MLAQGIANRYIFAGNLNLHDFESTKAPACQGGFVQINKKTSDFFAAGTSGYCRAGLFCRSTGAEASDRLSLSQYE
jgi:hypothetical protein